jgi:hypothetical protein
VKRTKNPSWMPFRVTQTRAAPGRLAVGTLGVLASCAIHFALIQAVFWGTGRVESTQTREGFGANAFGSSEEAITTMFFVEDASADVSNNDDMEDLSSAGKILQGLRVTILGPDPSIDAALKDFDAEDASPATPDQSVGEREARAALFGRYIGQIEARVERAWLRPRTPIGAEVFECRVRVQQSGRGAVVEITLKDCNGDPRWQVSLVNAVQGASPLPAPPDPSVFASSIELSFSSTAFSPDRTEQGFETPTVAAFNNNNTNRYP